MTIDTSPDALRDLCEWLHQYGKDADSPKIIETASTIETLSKQAAESDAVIREAFWTNGDGEPVIDGTIYRRNPRPAEHVIAALSRHAERRKTDA